MAKVLGVADEGGWVPRACTLPTVERPVRVTEFDELFGGGLVGLERRGSTRLVLVFDAASEARARDLAAREVGCCSFFGFAFSPGAEGQVVLDVTVPEAYVDVLDALAFRAAGAAGLSV